MRAVQDRSHGHNFILLTPIQFNSVQFNFYLIHVTYTEHYVTKLKLG